MKHFALLLLLFSIACSRPQSSVKVIVGATLIDGKGGPPLEHSVVVVEGAVIRAAGRQTSVRIPPGSEKVDGAGRMVAPREREGVIEAGKPAELVLMRGDKVERTMSHGEWVEFQ